MQDEWFERLKAAIANDGRSLRDISLAAGLGPNYVQQMIKRDQPPKIATRDKLLEILEPSVAAQLRVEPPLRAAPILGLAGAGPEGTVLFAEAQGSFGEVPAPPGSGEQVAALEVRGNSMHGLAEDGWLLFYEERTEPRDEYMGEPCVCWLENGHVLVKIPEPTRFPGLYNLTSTNAPTMREVPVSEMALVMDIRPRRAAQRFIRRNPEQKVIDVQNGQRPEARK